MEWATNGLSLEDVSIGFNFNANISLTTTLDLTSRIIWSDQIQNRCKTSKTLSNLILVWTKPPRGLDKKMFTDTLIPNAMARATSIG